MAKQGEWCCLPSEERLMRRDWSRFASSIKSRKANFIVLPQLNSVAYAATASAGGELRRQGSYFARLTHKR